MYYYNRTVVNFLQLSELALKIMPISQIIHFSRKIAIRMENNKLCKFFNENDEK